MLIKDLLNELKKQGETVASIAKRVDGISEKPLRRALKEAGYIFQNKEPKGWHFVGEGIEPIDKSIFDYVKTTSHPKQQKVKTNSHSQPNETNVKPTSQEVKQPSPQSEMNVNYSKLMYDELKAIRGLLQTEKPQPNVMPPSDLLNRISGLNKDANKTRKTIVIDENIANKLNEFAKNKRVNKSDLLEVALLDLFEHYGGIGE